jgi:hypothetical protein
MQFAFRFFIFLLIHFFLINGLAAAGSKPPAVGGMLPDIILAVPKNADHQKYLGVTGKSTFTIPEIQAEVVIIQVFSMY